VALSVLFRFLFSHALGSRWPRKPPIRTTPGQTSMAMVRRRGGVDVALALPHPGSQAPGLPLKKLFKVRKPLLLARRISSSGFHPGPLKGGWSTESGNKVLLQTARFTQKSGEAGVERVVRERGLTRSNDGLADYAGGSWKPAKSLLSPNILTSAARCSAAGGLGSVGRGAHRTCLAKRGYRPQTRGRQQAPPAFDWGAAHQSSLPST